MEKEKEKIIMYDAPEAARKVYMQTEEQRGTADITAIGWLSIDNFFFKEEHHARYTSCTHKVCECGEIRSKYLTMCETCMTKKRAEKYQLLPYMEWDGKAPLFDQIRDKYYLTQDDIECDAEEGIEDNEGLSEPPSFQFVICEPVIYRQIDAEFWSDCLPEEGEPDETLMAKVNELNEFIKTLPPASYQPGKYRTSVDIRS